MTAPGAVSEEVMERLSKGAEGIKHLEFSELHVTMGLKEATEKKAEHETDQWKLLEKVRK